jgi:hypothetical protein
MTDADKHGEWSENHHALLELLKEWWNPPDELIATLPKGGISLKYLGHSDTSRALTECDPFWTWEPMSYTDDGQPFLTLNDQGQPVGLWAWLTVCGCRRPCYGSVMPGKGDALKELIGDCIRNGAMRFGVAGALWSKADRVEGTEKASKAPRKPKPTVDTNEAGKANYERLVKMYGEVEVKAALATLGVKRWDELVGDTIDRVDDLLHAKKLLADDMGATQE